MIFSFIFPSFTCAQAGRHSETLQLLFPSHAETKIVEASTIFVFGMAWKKKLQSLTVPLFAS